MKYKLIACDMDETFLNNKSLIPNNNIKIVEILDNDYNIKFVPASGRGVNNLKQEVKWLNFHKKDNEYVIGFNGASVSEVKNNNIIYLKTVDFNIAKEIYEFGINKKVGVHIYTYDNIYIYNNNDGERNHTREKSITWTEIDKDNINFLKNTKIVKLMYQSTNLDYLEKIKLELQEKISDVVSFTYSSNRYLEINALNVNKAVGLEKLCEYLDISIEETIAIGDNYNDIPMLKAAGLSIAVSNAVEDVKKIVDYVANSNNDDGILEEVFNKFIK